MCEGEEKLSPCLSARNFAFDIFPSQCFLCTPLHAVRTPTLPLQPLHADGGPTTKTGIMHSPDHSIPQDEDVITGTVTKYSTTVTTDVATDVARCFEFTSLQSPMELMQMYTRNTITSATSRCTKRSAISTCTSHRCATSWWILIAYLYTQQNWFGQVLSFPHATTELYNEASLWEMFIFNSFH